MEGHAIQDHLRVPLYAQIGSGSEIGDFFLSYAIKAWNGVV
jgi:hypothetical protein